MHRSLIGLVAAAGIGLGSFAEPAPAEAQCYGCAVGAGIIGGMAVGRRPVIIRRRHPRLAPMGQPMRRPRPAAGGRSAAFGSTASAIASARCRSVHNFNPDLVASGITPAGFNSRPAFCF